MDVSEGNKNNMNTPIKTTILTVNYNSAAFVINTLWCLEHITMHPYKVIIADNNSKPEDYAELEAYCADLDYVEVYRKEGFTLRGSMAHGTTLNELVKKVDTPYFSILDADATWLAKGWDEILMKQLDDTTKVIGTQASPGKPQDFPLMFCILFETEAFKKLDIDFRPKDISEKQDTGFEMREKYQSAGYSGALIEIQNTRIFKKGPFHHLVGIAEYYLPGHQPIFASHFGRGSSLGANKYAKGLVKWLYKIPLLGPSLLNAKGRREKQEWIDTCKRIVRTYDT